jgi:hypothetical protein
MDYLRGMKMDKTYMVGVRGESYSNDDGSCRQEAISNLGVGDAVKLVAQPMNKLDQWAVAVFSEEGVQIGFLPSDARDSTTLLRGEPMQAKIYRITGATNWFARTILGKKYLGVVLLVSKPEPDWTRYSKYCEVAKPFDERVVKAELLEKRGNVEEAILEYRALVNEIERFTLQDPLASAHRNKTTPVNRLTLCLEKKKLYEEGLAVIERYEKTFDPIQSAKSERISVQKRKDRLMKKLC